MEITTCAGYWRFQQVREGILRGTFTKDGCWKNESKLVRAEVFAGLTEPSGFTVRKRANSDEIQVTLPNRREVVITKAGLQPVDVVRYTTGGEPPRVEIVKTVDGQRTQISNLQAVVARQAFAGTIDFRIPKSAVIYGLGQDETGVFNKRGIKQYLYQHNMRTPMPFFATSLGYGVFFDCGSLMTYDDTGDMTRMTLDTVDQIDLYLLCGSMD